MIKLLKKEKVMTKINAGMLKPKAECKPCITIRNVLTIIKNNVQECYKNIRKDIRSYSTVNATVCTLDSSVVSTNPSVQHAFNPNVKMMDDIRKKARENYNPEYIDSPEAKGDFSVCETLKKEPFKFEETDRKNIGKAFKKAIQEMNAKSVK